jgi:hypothetical protein
LYHDVGQLTRVKFYLCPNYRDYTFLLLYEASTLPGVQVVIDKGIQVLIDNGRQKGQQRKGRGGEKAKIMHGS